MVTFKKLPRVNVVSGPGQTIRQIVPIPETTDDDDEDEPTPKQKTGKKDQSKQTHPSSQS